LKKSVYGFWHCINLRFRVRLQPRQRAQIIDKSVDWF